jgi:hypothetical protein
MCKTRNYTAFFEDGTFHHGMWGGNASSYRKHLETLGYVPTIICQRIRPLYVKDDAELESLKG